jgi:hypothetical protein
MAGHINGINNWLKQLIKFAPVSSFPGFEKADNLVSTARRHRASMLKNLVLART